MQTPEGKVKAQLKKLLSEYENTYVYFPISNGMGAPALDVIICHNGYFLSIECKKLGGKPTPRQVRTIAAIQKAKGMTFVFDGGEESVSDLVGWLEYAL